MITNTKLLNMSIKKLIKPISFLTQSIFKFRLGKKDIEEKTHQIEQFYKELQNKIYQRTEELEETNEELQTIIQNLKNTQDQLIEPKKMASLGNLVEGVAHELNTPIGIGLTGVTYFLEQNKDIQSKYTDENMTEEDFERYLTKTKEIRVIMFKKDYL